MTRDTIATALARRSAAGVVQPAKQYGESVWPGIVSCPGNMFVIRVRLAGGSVNEAWSTGRMMRNMSVLLKGGLDDQGRPEFIQQAHCLCNDGHALAAIRALEDLAGVVPPRVALLVRSLVQSIRCIQEHLLHFYQFHISDWACLESALNADPVLAARLAQQPEQDADYFRGAQERLKTLAEAQGTDAFGGGPATHPDYRGAEEFHLSLHAHGFEALQTGGMINKALGLLGCGPDGYRAYRPGGLPDDLDLGPAVRDRLHGLLAGCRDFVRTVFLGDMEQLAGAYPHWAELGRGSNFFSWADFIRSGQDSALFPGGIVCPVAGDPDGGWEVRPAQAESIAEDREPEWSEADRDHYRLHRVGHGLSFEWDQGEYFWLPAPRHGSVACEAGAVARVLAGWALGSDAVRPVVAEALDRGCLPPAAVNSTLGRVMSRAIECSILADAVLESLDELDALLSGGAARLSNDLHLPLSGVGTGCVEVPRGSLTHTIRLENGRIAAHDYLIPSLWNFSPRDAQGGRGPLERALLGTPVADPGNPLELLRTVHELDPCNGCRVVVEDLDTGRTVVVNAK